MPSANKMSIEVTEEVPTIKTVVLESIEIKVELQVSTASRVKSDVS